ncbi:hypothetical protein GRI44_10265 [Altererythrobacter confluentis]|uniref:Uncharacterized protein n=1 Tax=Allopontixanthobacter confluentis TaxID=1849021 RepID=A0A6L7GKE9_9SPHN|nr:hypothetical protein [Allopontixanthobacter confluentis]MXP15131.1 hypothetical protein [Allopontixanthobacter confluentis]
MFETTNTHAGFDAAMDGAADEMLLRPIAWSELVARLAAARDLRRLLVREASPAGGRFTAFADFRNAMLNDAQEDVNPDGLGARKDVEAIEVCAANNVTPGDREMQ